MVQFLSHSSASTSSYGSFSSNSQFASRHSPDLLIFWFNFPQPHLLVQSPHKLICLPSLSPTRRCIHPLYSQHIHLMTPLCRVDGILRRRSSIVMSKSSSFERTVNVELEACGEKGFAGFIYSLSFSLSLHTFVFFIWVFLNEVALFREQNSPDSLQNHWVI